MPRARRSSLTAAERRRFRQLARGTWRTDPDWLARHYPRRRRFGVLARCGIAALAVALILLGAVSGAMLVVFGGVLLGSGSLTSHVSSRH